jgi:hypothetical protein
MGAGCSGKCHRHCPKCQGLARAEWLEARRLELLPVPYFHVVFIVPAPVADLAFHNKAVVYSMLFRAAAQALRDVAAESSFRPSEKFCMPERVRDANTKA